MVHFLHKRPPFLKDRCCGDVRVVPPRRLYCIVLNVLIIDFDSLLWQKTLFSVGLSGL